MIFYFTLVKEEWINYIVIDFFGIGHSLKGLDLLS